MKNNENLLIEVICKTCRLGLNENEIKEVLKNESVDLKESLGFDSLLMVELIIELECIFNIEFDMNDLNINELKIYGGLKKFLEKYLQ